MGSIVSVIYSIYTYINQLIVYFNSVSEYNAISDVQMPIDFSFVFSVLLNIGSALVSYLIISIICAKLFSKAKRNVFGAFIPIYREFVLYKISNIRLMWFIIPLICSLIIEAGVVAKIVITQNNINSTIASYAEEYDDESSDFDSQSVEMEDDVTNTSSTFDSIMYDVSYVLGIASFFCMANIYYNVVKKFHGKDWMFALVLINKIFLLGSLAFFKSAQYDESVITDPDGFFGNLKNKNRQVVGNNIPINYNNTMPNVYQNYPNQGQQVYPNNNQYYR